MKLIAIFFCFTISLIAFGQIKDRNDDGRKIRIPVVLNIIYSNNAENIQDTLITNELNDLNLDLSAKTTQEPTLF